ncbi:MAG: hypothetical protein U5K54_22470 [Cytophagales bacterium]|nr:hypothetical protein [Cytophagales bacterium]
MRKNSPELLSELNSWMKEIKRTGTFQVIYKEYFESPRLTEARITSEYSSLAGKQLSPFDEQLKKQAATNRLGLAPDCFGCLSGI